MYFHAPLLRPSLTSLLLPKSEVTSLDQAFKTWNLLSENLHKELQRKAEQVRWCL